MNCACDLAWSHVMPSRKVAKVDTGWVTDMAPGGVGAVAASHETWVGPPLDEEDTGRTNSQMHETALQDGAARVLDPVFSHLLDETWLLRGKFFKRLGSGQSHSATS